jgi:hypothetical protein
MFLLAKVGIGLMGAVVVGGAMISSEGFIHVQVHEKQANGPNIRVIVPAAVVPLALEFVPNHHLARASAQVRPYLPIMEAAIPALEDCPDGVLVEVIDPKDKEHVMVAKSGGSIVVDVKDSNETVHVAVPLRAAQSSIERIAEAGGPI